ncbi:MAG: hypothetical protein LBB84_03225 [Tannerellaceae bacterium]|jgi:hypothetical protein|nr:hypothetical protein [Tannerellaceae bacterium]
MKRTFLFLLLTFAALYAKVTYDIWTANAPEASLSEGVLSDIAEKVTIVPLQSATPNSFAGKLRSIRQDGTNLFLINNDILYRFHISGEFICRITNPALMKAAEYVIDPLRKQLIVLGNSDDIYYYTFGGQLIAKRKPETRLPIQRMQAVTIYQDCIWTAEERMRFDLLTNEWLIEQQWVKYDIAFREMESHRLLAANLPNKPILPFGRHIDIAVEEDTGMIYACSPSLLPDDLLKDSLLLNSGQIFPGLSSDKDQLLAFPLRFGQRFWLASSFNPTDAAQNYIFCFDRTTLRSWQLNAGFEDDFYHTGRIREWQAMDVYSRRYCFSKSGEEVQHVSRSGAPVIFIVELKA